MASSAVAAELHYRAAEIRELASEARDVAEILINLGNMVDEVAHLIAGDRRRRTGAEILEFKPGKP